MKFGPAVAALLIVASVGASAGAQSKTAKKGAPAPARLHFVVAPTGNEARYRVQEQLIGVDFPNEAVGVTHDITGGLLVEPNGTVVTDSSRITVTLTNLKSDKDRRDLFIKKRTLETEKFPTVQLVPRTFTGLTAKPGAAPCTFEVIGDLTVRGVTRPTTWKVSARAEGDDIVGTASTAFTFKDFSMDQPSVAVVLSVADTIKLEYDFRFAPVPKTP
ncbi:MAG: YceI family protein [Gemmatimonadetes bacterium]|nr:YceI family protein [Gemmatimonadota bacterium]